MREILPLILLYFFYAAVLALLIALGIFFYMRAVISRKTYRCPKCGEIARVELMHAAHCNTCGAPLNLPEKHHD